MPVTAPACVAFGVGERAREPEVGELHGAVGREEDVLGLQVAVHDALRVGVLEREQGLAHDLGGLRGREPAVGVEEVAHGPAVHVLHHHVVDAVDGAPVVDGDDVRVVQRGGGARLAAEPVDEPRIARQRAVQDLDRRPRGRARRRARGRPRPCRRRRCAPARGSGRRGSRAHGPGASAEAVVCAMLLDIVLPCGEALILGGSASRRIVPPGEARTVEATSKSRIGRTSERARRGSRRRSRPGRRPRRARVLAASSAAIKARPGARRRPTPTRSGGSTRRRSGPSVRPIVPVGGREPRDARRAPGRASSRSCSPARDRRLVRGALPDRGRRAPGRSACTAPTHWVVGRLAGHRGSSDYFLGGPPPAAARAEDRLRDLPAGPTAPTRPGSTRAARSRRRSPRSSCWRSAPRRTRRAGRSLAVRCSASSQIVTDVAVQHEDERLEEVLAASGRSRATRRDARGRRGSVGA